MGELPSKYKGTIILKFSDSLSLFSKRYIVPAKYKKKCDEELDSLNEFQRFYYFSNGEEEIYSVDYSFNGVTFSSAYNPKLNSNWLAKVNTDSMQRIRMIKRYMVEILGPIEKEIDKDKRFLKYLRK